MANAWKLSPSDFAFLWEECKRCFYLKVARGFQRPRSIMPKIFTNIDSQMKQFFAAKRTKTILPTLPAGIVEYGDKWVESIPFKPSSQCSECFIRGKVDTILKLDDGSYAVIDFKTAETRSEHIPLYARQLNAYALALEKAAPGKLSLTPVTTLGLVVYEPRRFQSGTAAASLEGSMTWIEIARDDDSFTSFLAEMLHVLDQPNPPGGAAGCEWCLYRDTSRRTGL